MTKSLPSFPSVKILSSSGPIRGQNSFFPLCAAILQIAACYDQLYDFDPRGSVWSAPLFRRFLFLPHPIKAAN